MTRGPRTAAGTGNTEFLGRYPEPAVAGRKGRNSALVLRFQTRFWRAVHHGPQNSFID